ncbi:CoA transferase [Frankia sp. CNm7]|uniref:CoA transferase n=1 Tax=Frankia nepalensis TaxID=1836974 RepID=A0A937RGK8_9ACTN|nr:CoA transferase [Frankia nepalensis]MBL7502360.1 CoA transferase [Frankia nepalensis]MBL7516187.1 CoA transferase [Frankia nepalensis]MBL7522093.1 CoA transferase [Frankia nepalensis]MBL7625676.1 CoA transferase [Frankia nepalensis]
MTAVMRGIRVLEVAEHTFVPAASAVLADWGAEVIKIEHVTRGDAMRGLASTGVLDLGAGGVHVLFEHSNRGKRSLALDLSVPEGLEILYRLVEVCDVFLTNKLPRVRSSLGIEVDDIRERNPNIIYVRGSGYGDAGPDANNGGYDILGYWARSGLAAGASPADLDRLVWQPGPAYGDSIGAMTIAGGIAAALLHRERTGEAPVVDVSLLATGMWAQGAGIALAMRSGVPWGQPAADQLRNPLTNSYRTLDGRWIFLSCLQYFHYWPEMCRVLGRLELVDDERFASFEALTANCAAAIAILEEEFRSATLAEWRERLADFRGQWAPVQNAVEVVDDPQVVANGYVQETSTKDGVPFRLVAPPVRFDDQPAVPTRAPEFNEHAEEILTDLLGLDWDTVIDMKLKGVVA